MIQLEFLWGEKGKKYFTDVKKPTLVIDKIKGKPELLVDAGVQLSFTMSLLSVPLTLQLRLISHQAFPCLMEAWVGRLDVNSEIA